MDNVNNVLGALLSSYPTRSTSATGARPSDDALLSRVADTKPTPTDRAEISAEALLAAERARGGSPVSAPAEATESLPEELLSNEPLPFAQEGGPTEAALPTSDTRADEASDSEGATESAEQSEGPQRPGELTPDQEEEVEELKRRDAEVRAHEQAHKAAAGPYGGAISYEYQSGPDGKRYAVGGSVPIDASEIPNDPQATIRKMEQVRRAALAPTEPSAQDRRVASTASRKLQEARAELYRSNAEGNNSDSETPAVGSKLDVVA